MDHPVPLLPHDTTNDTCWLTTFHSFLCAFYSVPSGKVEELVGAKHNANPQWASPDLLVFSQDSQMSPADLWSLRMDTRQVSRLTDINADLRRETIMSTPVSFNFEGAGDSVQAWLFKPVNFEAGKKYPLAVLIHGGYAPLPQRTTQTTNHSS